MIRKIKVVLIIQITIYIQLIQNIIISQPGIVMSPKKVTLNIIL